MRPCGASRLADFLPMRPSGNPLHCVNRSGVSADGLRNAFIRTELDAAIPVGSRICGRSSLRLARKCEPGRGGGADTRPATLLRLGRTRCGVSCADLLTRGQVKSRHKAESPTCGMTLGELAWSGSSCNGLRLLSAVTPLGINHLQAPRWIASALSRSPDRTICATSASMLQGTQTLHHRARVMA